MSQDALCSAMPMEALPIQVSILLQVLLLSPAILASLSAVPTRLRVKLLDGQECQHVNVSPCIHFDKVCGAVAQ